MASAPDDTIFPVPRAGAARLLVFDSSTELLALAAQGPAGAFSLHLPGGARASALLLPQAHRLLAQAGIRLADLEAIGFGQGPGAFTGLRTACAAAQGLGLGLNRPLVPVNSLWLVAEDARRQLAWPASKQAVVAVAMDARMDEAYAALWAWRDGRWMEVQAAALYTLAGLQEAWSGTAIDVVAGSALAAYGARLLLPAGAVRVPHEHNRAAALLALAAEAFAQGQAVDAASALPLYLRDKVAQTTAERAQAHGIQAV